MTNKKTYQITFTGIIAALSYVVFTFLQFKIVTGPGDATSIHLGNAVCVLGALLLGGFYGGLGGALGMTIGDLLIPEYIIYAPKTFFLKLCIGLIVGLIAHKIGHISTSNDSKHVFKYTLLSSIAGLLFNTIFDPIIGYFYKILIIGRPAAEVTFAINVVSTSINSVISIIAATTLYMALYPIIKKNRLLPKIGGDYEHRNTKETSSNK